MFDSILSFLKLTQSLAAVNRDQKSYDLSRKENDSEHSYQLAMTVWYLVNNLKLSLNRERLLMNALVHDMVEVYAGDSAPFSSDQEYNNKIIETKTDRENEAFLRLKKEFPDFEEMTSVIENYEKKLDAESRFVYIVDKIIADLNCYLSGERYYVDRSFSLSQWTEWYSGKFKKLGNTSELEKSLLDAYYNFVVDHKEYYFKN